MALAGNSRQQLATVGNSPVATSGGDEERDLKYNSIRLAPIPTVSVNVPAEHKVLCSWGNPPLLA